MSLKAAIYDPYLDTLGGGERYCLSVAEILSQNGYEVDIFWSGDQDILIRAQDRFALDLSTVKLVPDIFGLTKKRIELIEENLPENFHSRPAPNRDAFSRLKKFLNKRKVLSDYDFLFYLSDGSSPFLFAKKNFLHVQVPFVTKFTASEKFLNSLKARFIDKVICNSQFTSKFLTSFPGNKITVLYPPVDVAKLEGDVDKKKIILSVGRFDNILNAKKQDVLIKAFIKFYKQSPKTDWKLVLAGGSREVPEKNNYLLHLQEIAKSYPIHFVVNPSFEELKKIYARSSIYWHAAGFEVDEYLTPEQTEHFGMTVVEAMDSGLVPLVVAKGGLTEIVHHEKNGYIWQSIDKLADKTKLLIDTPKTLVEMSQKAHKSAQAFSKEVFAEKLLSLIRS